MYSLKFEIQVNLCQMMLLTRFLKYSARLLFLCFFLYALNLDDLTFIMKISTNRNFDDLNSAVFLYSKLHKQS